MKSHLDRCLSTHGAKCERARHTLWEPSQRGQQTELDKLPANFRLINVHDLKVVDAPAQCRYAALSYVWDHENLSRHMVLSKSTFDRLHSLRGLRQSCLPQSVTDAINVRLQLGISYVWIDSLCIIQDDDNDKADQLDQMDKIYSLAMLTIVEANGTRPSDGLACLRSRIPPQLACHIGGVRFFSAEPDLEDILGRNRWYRRGWTYQEFLFSKRLLIFTSSQTYLVCTLETYAEDTQHHVLKHPEKYTGGFTHSRHDLHAWDMPSIESSISCWSTYNDAVKEYTKRHLTFSSDTLNAISGILRAFGRYCDDSFLCGLPAKQFPHGLLWQPIEAHQRNPPWPSWSWAGWKGAVATPASGSVDHQWGSGSGRTIFSSLQDLRLRRDDGTEMLIDQLPSDDSLRLWLHSSLSHERPQRQPLPDRGLIDGGILLFRSRSAFLSTVPAATEDTAPHMPDSPLVKHKLMNGGEWVGSVFLTQDCAKTYENGAEMCEFVELTSFRVLLRNLNSHFLRMPAYMGADRLPEIFDPEFYRDAVQQSEMEDFWRRSESERPESERSERCWDEGGRISLYEGRPPKIYLKHVMWIERKDGICSRVAVGVIANCDLDWTDGSYSLG
ncbi:hypothetical protein MAPG_12055 [Magnaporthiopsis poae ATCC 64411]|uniref:Heterokaryon incompatibility domain-containing protein n=1 Tax=Magnaporthiopsis poae (strain ATCC 64411 / 73-15) TaxID=644358 RepID=A0A0C4EGR3_MAGP6|nr:hypothetical protein MAPG_12055 [Magnaporthiopsis poae ATCC 64411]